MNFFKKFKLKLLRGFFVGLLSLSFGSFYAFALNCEREIYVNNSENTVTLEITFKGDEPLAEKKFYGVLPNLAIFSCWDKFKIRNYTMQVGDNNDLVCYIVFDPINDESKSECVNFRKALDEFFGKIETKFNSEKDGGKTFLHNAICAYISLKKDSNFKEYPNFINMFKKFNKGCIFESKKEVSKECGFENSEFVLPKPVSPFFRFFNEKGKIITFENCCNDAGKDVEMSSDKNLRNENTFPINNVSDSEDVHFPDICIALDGRNNEDSGADQKKTDKKDLKFDFWEGNTENKLKKVFAEDSKKQEGEKESSSIPLNESDVKVEKNNETKKSVEKDVKDQPEDFMLSKKRKFGCDLSKKEKQKFGFWEGNTENKLKKVFAEDSKKQEGEKESNSIPLNECESDVKVEKN